MVLDNSDTPTPMGDARALEQEFERLLETPAGSVIYDQLARIVSEWQAIEKRVAITYTSLLRLLLEDFAAEPTSEHVLALAGQLIQRQPRHMASPTFTTATPAEFAKQLAGNDALHEALRILLERLSEPSPAQHLVTSEGDRTDAGILSHASKARPTGLQDSRCKSVRRSPGASSSAICCRSRWTP
jgi:hypothetical protein